MAWFNNVGKTGNISADYQLKPKTVREADNIGNINFKFENSEYAERASKIFGEDLDYAIQMALASLNIDPEANEI